MHETVIEGVVRICFFLAAVCSYAYIFWFEKLRAATVLGPQGQTNGIETKQENLVFATQQLTPPISRQAGGAGKSSTQTKMTAAGDWLVPLIVWVLVILMAAAIVGFLLGDK